MKKFFVVIFFILIHSLTFAQLTKDDVREVLTLQGSQMVEFESEQLYDRYLEINSNTKTLIGAIVGSSVAGVGLGAHESFTFNYTNSSWLPSYLQDWYSWRPKTDAVFGKVFTWQKVFRDVDYFADRYAWNKWKEYFKQSEFWSWQTVVAYLCHFTVKNTFATLIRDKFKYNDFFNSFQVDLIIP